MSAHRPDSVSGAPSRVIMGPQEMASDEGGSRVSSASPVRYCASHFHCCCRSVAQSCLTLCDPGLQPARLLCPWDSPRKNTRGGCHFLLHGNLPDPRIESTSPALAGRFFTAELPGKPQGVREVASISQSLNFKQPKNNVKGKQCQSLSKSPWL